MNLLKRKPAEVVVEAEPEAPTGPGKNAPTPKRNEARAARAKAAKGQPRTRKELADRRRQIRVDTMESLKSTDPAKLPPNERIPELVLARDLVDSRKNLASLLLPAFALYFVGTAVPGNVVRAVVLYVVFAFFFTMLGEAYYLSRRVTARVHERFPGSTLKLTSYVFRRMFAPKRMRRPVVRPVPPQNAWKTFTP